MEEKRTRNKKIANFVGGSVVAFSYMIFLSLAFLLCLTLWCNAVYLTATCLLEGDAVNNFMDGLKMNRTLAPFRIAKEGGTHSYDFPKIRAVIVFMYIGELCILLATIPQYLGGAHLIKAAEKGVSVRQSYWRATRHQNIQYSALLAESSLLLGYSVVRSVGEWDDPYHLYWGVSFMSVVMLVRVIFLIMVEMFVKELYEEATKNYGGMDYNNRCENPDNAVNIPMLTMNRSAA